MEMLKNALNWFEIPVLDFDRAREFYSAVYDYEMPERQLGDTRMGFFEHDYVNRAVGGAIVAGPGYVPSNAGAKIYLHTGVDLSPVLARVDGAGGKIILGKTSLGENLGFKAVIEDTEGNHISLHSPD